MGQKQDGQWTVEEVITVMATDGPAADFDGFARLAARILKRSAQQVAGEGAAT